MCPMHQFQEMPLIFKNTEVSRGDIGVVYMREYAEQHHLLIQPRRTLIGTIRGGGILFANLLL